MERPSSMLMMDPPDHTRLRKLVSKAFTPRTVEQLRPHVAELIDGMLDAADPSGFDLIADRRLPAAGDGDLRAARRTRRRTSTCSGRGAPTRPGCSTATSTTPRSSEGSSPSCRSSTTSTASSRSAGPTPATTSSPRLLAAEEEGDKLSEEELRSTVVLLFVAGHETTTNLIGNGTVALLRQRDAVGPARAPTRRWRRARWRRCCATTARSTSPAAPPPCRPEVGDVTVETGPGAASRCWRRPTAIPSASPTPTGSTSPGPTTTTSPSATASTTASAPRWPVSRARRCSRRSPSGSPTLELTEEPVHREHFVLRGYQAVHVAAWLTRDDRRVTTPGLEELRLYDTRTRQLQRFAPLHPPAVGIYSCGPTVYAPQHLGNMRSQLFPDLLRRVLLAAGYDVTYVTNVTDVGHLVSDARRGRRQDGAGGRRHRRRRPRRSRRFYTEQWADRPSPARLPRARPRAARGRAHRRADRHGPHARGAGPHLRDRRRRLLRRVDVPPLRRVRPPRPRRARDQRPHRARRGQAPPGRLRAVEAHAAGRAAPAGVGLPVGPRLPRLAHRVLGHGHQVPRHQLRHPHRRRRPHPGAPHQRGRPERVRARRAPVGAASGCTTSSSTSAARRSRSRRATCSSSTRSSSAASTRWRSATSSSRPTTASSRRSPGRRSRRPPTRTAGCVGHAVAARDAGGEPDLATRRAPPRAVLVGAGRRPQRAAGAGRGVGRRPRPAPHPGRRVGVPRRRRPRPRLRPGDVAAPDADESGSDPRIDALVAERRGGARRQGLRHVRSHPRRAGRRGHRAGRHPDGPHLAARWA